MDQSTNTYSAIEEAAGSMLEYRLRQLEEAISNSKSADGRILDRRDLLDIIHKLIDTRKESRLIINSITGLKSVPFLLGGMALLMFERSYLVIGIVVFSVVVASMFVENIMMAGVANSRAARLHMQADKGIELVTDMLGREYDENVGNFLKSMNIKM